MCRLVHQRLRIRSTSPIYAGASKRPLRLSFGSESTQEPATVAGSSKRLKQKATDNSQLIVAPAKSNAERILEGPTSLEDTNALHAALLARYAPDFMNIYRTKLFQHSISTSFIQGLEALGFHEGKQKNYSSPTDIENAIQHFKSAADLTAGLLEPEIPLSSVCNLIRIYENNELNESHETQQSGLLDALRRGLEVAAAVTDSNALSVIDPDGLRQTPNQDLAKIYKHVMKHWDLFSEEEKGPLREKILQQMITNEVFLDITYGVFRRTVFADAYLNNNDPQSRQEFAEALEKRIEKNKSYKRPEDGLSHLTGASNVLRDVHLEQWKKEPTQENLQRVLTGIDTLMQPKPRDWNKESVPLRLFDLFIHAEDPGMKKQIAAKAVDMMNMMTGLDVDDYFRDDVSAEMSYSRVALGKMTSHHLAEGGSVDKDNIKKMLEWLSQCCSYISYNRFNQSSVFAKTSKGKFHHSDQDRFLLLKCACNAASLIVEISKNENVGKLGKLELSKSGFDTFSDRLKHRMRGLHTIANGEPKSGDEGFVEMNLHLKMHIKKILYGAEVN